MIVLLSVLLSVTVLLSSEITIAIHLSYSLAQKFTLKPYSNRKTEKLCIYLLFLAKKIRDRFTCGGGERGKEGSEGGGGGGGVVGWCQRRAPSLFFYNHFEELQTVLFEVELIIDNGPLT